MWNRIGIAAASAVLTLTPAPAATAASNPLPGCAHPDRSPGVVTRYEWRHVVTGTPRHRVSCHFGVRGHAVAGYWGDDLRWHEAVRYPTDGGFADIVYVERQPGYGLAGLGLLHAQGRDYRTWYPAP